MRLFALEKILFEALLIILALSSAGCTQEPGIPPQSSWIDYGMVVDGEKFGAGWDSFFEGFTPGALVKKGDTYFLYYVGAADYISQKNNIGPANRSIGVATSTDGVNWKKFGKKPVLTYTSSGNPEEGAVSVGVVVDPRGVFHALYGANQAADPRTPSVSANVMYATSPDGLHFTAHGMVLRSDCTFGAWGCGDELHANIAWLENGVFYVYYVPNGVAERGRQGVAWGPNPMQLDGAGPLLPGGDRKRRGTGSIVPISDSEVAYFLGGNKETVVRKASRTNVTALSAPVYVYDSLPGGGKVFYLNKERRTWLMIYDDWAYMGLMMAPSGAPDDTPPGIPRSVTAIAESHDRVKLSWEGAVDPDTGVVRYNIYRDGEKTGTTKKREFNDLDLREETSYTYQVRAVNFHGYEGKGSDVKATTPADVSPPEILWATASGNADKISVVFNEPVDRNSAVDTANYASGPGLKILSAGLGADGRTVTLTTSVHANNQLFALKVKNVADDSRNKNRSDADTVYTYSDISGLSGYYRLDRNARSSATDTSGYAIHGTVHGLPEWSAGKMDTAIKLNGISDFIQIDDVDHLHKVFSKSFSVTCWVFPEDIPPHTTNSNQAYTIFSGPNARIHYEQVIIDGKDRARFKAMTRLSNGNRPGTVSGPRRPETWHHIAMVVDDEAHTVSLFVNGKPAGGSPERYAGSLRRLPVPDAFSNMKKYYMKYRIGVHDPSFDFEKNFFKGYLDEIRIYDRALSSSEIQEIYTLDPAKVSR